MSSEANRSSSRTSPAPRPQIRPVPPSKIGPPARVGESHQPTVHAALAHRLDRYAFELQPGPGAHHVLVQSLPRVAQLRLVDYVQNDTPTSLLCASSQACAFRRRGNPTRFAIRAASSGVVANAPWEL